MSDLGAWTIQCSRGFTPAELAEAVADASEHVELRYVGALSRAQSTFVKQASSASWVHLTLWDPVESGLTMDVERDTGNPAPPFVIRAEASIATDRFADEPARRTAATAVAKRIVELICEKLEANVTAFDAAGAP